MGINLKKNNDTVVKPQERATLELRYFRKYPDYLYNKFNAVGFDPVFEKEVILDEAEIYYKRPSFWKRIFKSSKISETEGVFLQKQEKIERIIKRETSSIPFSGGIKFFDIWDEELSISKDKEIKVVEETNVVALSEEKESKEKNILENQESEESIEPFITQVKASDIEAETIKEEIIEDVVVESKKEEVEKIDEIFEDENLENKTSEINENEDEDESIFEYAKAPLASNKEIQELEKQHMEFYNILALIQETHTPNDFKSAYNIQDRIAYLLNHQTLLYKSLVLQLITYLKSINTKLKNYNDEISKKQTELKNYNSKISDIKEYKWKTDDSMQIIEENGTFMKKEFDKSEEISEKTPNT